MVRRGKGAWRRLFFVEFAGVHAGQCKERTMEKFRVCSPFGFLLH